MHRSTRTPRHAASLARQHTEATVTAPDPFAKNAERHDAYRRCAEAALQRRMLVILDDETPLVTLTQSAAVVRSVLGPFLRPQKSNAVPLSSSQRKKKGLSAVAGRLDAETSTSARPAVVMFSLLSFVMRCAVRRQRRMRAALLRYVHRRRARIERCLAAWIELDRSAPTRGVPFFAYVYAFVPNSAKRTAVVAHHAMCAHTYATITMRQVERQRATLQDFFHRVLSLRTVSSRAFRGVQSLVQLCVAAQAPHHQFDQVSAPVLIRLAVRVVHVPQILRDQLRSVDRGSPKSKKIANVDDRNDLPPKMVARMRSDLRRINRASDYGQVAVVAAAYNLADDEAFARWRADRVLALDASLPDKAEAADPGFHLENPLVDCPALKRLWDQPLVSRAIIDRDHETIVALAPQFENAWGERLVREGPRTKGSSRSLSIQGVVDASPMAPRKRSSVSRGRAISQFRGNPAEQQRRTMVEEASKSVWRERKGETELDHDCEPSAAPVLPPFDAPPNGPTPAPPSVPRPNARPVTAASAVGRSGSRTGRPHNVAQLSPAQLYHPHPLRAASGSTPPSVSNRPSPGTSPISRAAVGASSASTSPLQGEFHRQVSLVGDSWVSDAFFRSPVLGWTRLVTAPLPESIVRQKRRLVQSAASSTLKRMARERLQILSTSRRSTKGCPLQPPPPLEAFVTAAPALPPPKTCEGESSTSSQCPGYDAPVNVAVPFRRLERAADHQPSKPSVQTSMRPLQPSPSTMVPVASGLRVRTVRMQPRGEKQGPPFPALHALLEARSGSPLGSEVRKGIAKVRIRDLQSTGRWVRESHAASIDNDDM